MPKYTMDMVLEYAKVFPENADMGSPDGSRAAQAVHSKGGQYKVNLYFTDEEQIQQLLGDGLDPRPMNNDRIKEGREEFGIGKYMEAKRSVQDNVKVFENKSGPVEINYGGAPGVVDLRDPDNKRWWSFEEDGTLGNGTRAMVQFETYSNGAGVRLKNIGVTELVEWEPMENPDDELFKVD